MFSYNVSEISRKIFGQHSIRLPVPRFGFTGTIVPIKYVQKLDIFCLDLVHLCAKN